jgi:hypothetical protein
MELGDGADRARVAPAVERLTLFAAGGPGRDRLFGDHGANLLLGGPGDDRIEPHWLFTFRRVGVRWRCGSGTDRVSSQVLALTLPRDCERMLATSVVIERVGRAARAVRLALHRGLPRRCRIIVRIGDGRVLSLTRGRRRTLRRQGSSRSLRLRFVPTRACRYGRHVIVRVRF